MPEKDPKLVRAGVKAYNTPKRTPNHPTKSHVVVAKEGSTTRVRFQMYKTGSTFGKLTVVRTELRGKN